MQDQNKKICKWIAGLFVSMIVLVILELLIAKAIYPNDQETFKTILSTMMSIDLFVYFIILTIKIVQYQKFVRKYEQNKIEETKKELTSEFKKVFINYSGDISKDEFECKAKVDENGKIICEIFLDMKTSFESYEDFHKYFHF